MTTTHLPPNSTLERFDADAVDGAQLAAVSFLARYNGRTLEAYRHDLRYFFQWATDSGLAVLDATRAHIEMYRSIGSSTSHGFSPISMAGRR